VIMGKTGKKRYSGAEARLYAGVETPASLPNQCFQ